MFSSKLTPVDCRFDREIDGDLPENGVKFAQKMAPNGLRPIPEIGNKHARRADLLWEARKEPRARELFAFRSLEKCKDISALATNSDLKALHATPTSFLVVLVVVLVVLVVVLVVLGVVLELVRVAAKPLLLPVLKKPPPGPPKPPPGRPKPPPGPPKSL